MHDDFSREAARDIGGLQADMRTVKHDIGNMSGKMDALGAKVDSKFDALTTQVASINTQQQRGLGFFAGAAFILVTAGGVLIGFAKLVFNVSS